MPLPNILQVTEKLITNHSPLILTAMGAAGTVATAVLSAKATVTAVRVVDDIELDDGPISTKEKVKATWKLYVPALSTAAVTVTCIILANRIGTRRAAALAAAYQLSQEGFDEYREKIKEKFGEKKEREAREEVAADRVNRSTAPVPVIVPGSLRVLCYDEFSNRFFESSAEQIKKAENDTNWELIHHDSASLNLFYSKVGLDPVQYGEQVGWNAFRKLDLKLTSVLRGDNVPALSIAFSYDPEPRYDSNH